MAVTHVTERGDGTRRVQLELSAVSLVEQSHREECNINSILAKYRKTGFIKQRTDARYGDFSLAADFHAVKNRIMECEGRFLDLPSDIRTKFDNDPGAFLEFVNDPENVEECVELGLLPKEALSPEEPVAAVVEDSGASEGEPEDTATA